MKPRGRFIPTQQPASRIAHDESRRCRRSTRRMRRGMKTRFAGSSSSPNTALRQSTGLGWRRIWFGCCAIAAGAESIIGHRSRDCGDFQERYGPSQGEDRDRCSRRPRFTCRNGPQYSEPAGWPPAAISTYRNGPNQMSNARLANRAVNVGSRHISPR
jgi:hypothetical protein